MTLFTRQHPKRHRGKTGHIVAEPLGRSVVSDALRAWRKRERLSLEAAAERLDVSWSTYRQWEYSGKIPQPATMTRLAPVIGFDVRVLLEADA